MVGALAASGCSDDAPLRRLPAFAQGCETEAFEACDVFDAQCQEQTFSAVRCLRNSPEAVRPEVRSITVAQYTEELTRGSAPSAEAQAEATRQQRVLEGVLQGLGLAEPGDFSEEEQVELSTSSIPGYYNSGDDRITLIEPEEEDALSDEERTSLLAHEFVHALQDQQVDLGQLARATRRTFDAYLARLGMVEGEATMLETFFALTVLGVLDPVDFRRYFVSWVPSVEDSFVGFSPLRSAPRYVPYSFGARYVFNLYAERGSDAVEERLAEPPPSMLPMLSSVRTLLEPEAEPEEYMALVRPPDNMEQVAFDRLGPWIVRKLLDTVDPLENWEPLTNAWRGDRFILYDEPALSQPENLPLAGVWSIRFVDERAAETFEDVLRSALESPAEPAPAPHLALVERSGQDVSLVVSNQDLDESALLGWSERIAEAIANPPAMAPQGQSEEPMPSAGPLLLPLTRAFLPSCLH